MRRSGLMRTVATLTVVAGVLLRAQAQTLVANEAKAGGKEEHSDIAPHLDASAPGVSSRYVLGAADVIRINVWKVAELSQTVTVGPDGFVSMPLLGDVHAAGSTASELARDLSARLGTYVVSAQVTVSVLDPRSRQVFVTGQVGRPGAYPLIAPMTVLQLLAQAGGLTTFANRKGIFILRKAEGDSERLKFNYTAALHGDVKQNIPLQPGDTVIIP